MNPGTAISCEGDSCSNIEAQLGLTIPCSIKTTTTATASE